MNVIIKENSEVLNITKDIQERNQIIHDYITYGILNRNKVIEKISELQFTSATKVIQSAHGYVRLEFADDSTMIENLQFQINILEGKLIDKIRKNTTEESK